MRIYLGLVGLVATLSGRTGVTAYTKIESDGSFVRTVRYESDNSAGTLANLESGFDLPNTHPGVSYRTTISDGMPVLTTSRRVSAGHPVPPDITVLGLDRKPHIRCQVSVQKLPNGDVSYDETVHWMGAQPDLSPDNLNKIDRTWDKILPERFRTGAYESKATLALMKLTSQLIFGPPYPYSLDVAATPDLVDLDLSQRLESRIAEPLKQLFPGMTDQELQEVITKSSRLSQSDLSQMSGQEDAKPASRAEAKNGLLIPEETNLLFVVKPPGAVVQTNGLTTRDGHVYWSLYQQSLLFGDATLHLVAHPGEAK